MKPRYRLFRRRGSMFYCFDNATRLYTSLRTTDRKLADELVRARNQAEVQPVLARQIGKAYLSQSDPLVATRTWRHALTCLMDTKAGPTRLRWERAAKETALHRLLDLPLLDTQGEHLLRALKEGTVSTNVHLRKLHNFVLDMGWLPWPVVPKRQWPKVQFGAKRAITLEEHQRIVAGERNPERRAFYELAWHLGAAQSDLAALRAEDVDWEHQVIRFVRRKTGRRSIQRFGPQVAAILRSLPVIGPLFPAFSQLREAHRATEFRRACRRVGVSGVTLHCYRYAWAQRAKCCGYPERFAQTALGHNSRAVHEAYASGAVPECPSLEEFERVKPLKAVSAASAA
jgi:integrase